MFVRRCVPRVPDGPVSVGLLVWKMVVGLWVRPSWGGLWSGMGMLLGSRTATPGLFPGAVRCPAGSWRAFGAVVVWRVRGGLRTG